MNGGWAFICIYGILICIHTFWKKTEGQNSHLKLQGMVETWRLENYPKNFGLQMSASEATNQGPWSLLGHQLGVFPYLAIFHRRFARKHAGRIFVDFFFSLVIPGAKKNRTWSSSKIHHFHDVIAWSCMAGCVILANFCMRVFFNILLQGQVDDFIWMLLF